MIRIPTKTHGIMDFVYGATFLAAPFLLKALDKNENSNGRKNGKNNGKGNNQSNSVLSQNVVLPAMGAGILAQGLMTNHEFGAVKAMNMKTHLLMDIALGGLMIASPWLLKMNKNARIPMVALGATTIGLALMTQLEPSYEQLEGVYAETDTLLDEIEDELDLHI